MFPDLLKIPGFPLWSRLESVCFSLSLTHICTHMHTHTHTHTHKHTHTNTHTHPHTHTHTYSCQSCIKSDRRCLSCLSTLEPGQSAVPLLLTLSAFPKGIH